MGERRYQIVKLKTGIRHSYGSPSVEYVLYDSACAWERLMASRNENDLKKERRRLERGDG